MEVEDRENMEDVVFTKIPATSIPTTLSTHRVIKQETVTTHTASYTKPSTNLHTTGSRRLTSDTVPSTVRTTTTTRRFESTYAVSDILQSTRKSINEVNEKKHKILATITSHTVAESSATTNENDTEVENSMER